MGGVIYSGALRGGFLDCSRRSGRCASILGFADCGARGGNSHAYASASYKEGGDVERKAGYHSARGYGVPVLRGAIVDAGFAMVVPALRSGEERGGAKLETRTHLINQSFANTRMLQGLKPNFSERFRHG